MWTLLGKPRPVSESAGDLAWTSGSGPIASFALLVAVALAVGRLKPGYSGLLFRVAFGVAIGNLVAMSFGFYGAVTEGPNAGGDDLAKVAHYLGPNVWTKMIAMYVLAVAAPLAGLASCVCVARGQGASWLWLGGGFLLLAAGTLLTLFVLMVATGLIEKQLI